MFTKSKKDILKIFMMFLFSFCLFANTPEVVYGQQPNIPPPLPGNYTPLAPLPGTFDASTGKTTLATYLPGLFTFTIYAAGVLAFAMITYAGIQYMTTDAVFKKEEARSTLTGAVGGLLLVLASYAILYTINPRILEFDLRLNRINIERAASVTGSSSSSTPSGKYNHVVGGTNVYYDDCNSCDSIKGVLPVKGANMPADPKLNTELVDKLKALDTEMKNQNVPWEITEGHPPMVNHANACHKVGTCADGRPKMENLTAENIKKMFEASQRAGLYVELETNNPTLISELQSLGYTGKIIPINYPTHLSIYRNSSKN